MSDVRIIFSPHTADPRYLWGLAGAAAAAQAAVVQTAWAAQFRLLNVIGQAMLQAHCTVLDNACRATAWRG